MKQEEITSGLTTEEVVRELNGLIYDKGEHEMYFQWTTNGFSEIITFNDYVLYNSEDHDREWIEKINYYEPLIPFLKRKYNEMVDRLTKIKFESL